ncbi:MAG: PAC2 family protein [Acidimicrobiia bacterium]
MDHLIWREQPNLRNPMLVAAFEGWNDVAEAASDAAVWLIQEYSGRAVAGIDPEEFVNFQEQRPRIRLQDGVTRQLQWPGNEFYALELPDAERDLVVLLGIEPHNRWRTFTETVIDAAGALGCTELVTFGALLADAPHTREPNVTGIGADDTLQRRLELSPSSYEGPTGIVGVLHDTWRRHDRRATSLWVAVPHYIATPPNPVAIRALLSRFDRLGQLGMDLRELDAQVLAWRERVDAIVADDEEAREYVERLEQEADEAEQLSDVAIPSGDAIAAELEAFLRNRDEQ